MKKIIALLMAILMVASMAACGGEENEITVHSENAIANAFANLAEQIAENGGYVSISTNGNLLASLGAESEGLTISGFDMNHNSFKFSLK